MAKFTKSRRGPKEVTKTYDPKVNHVSTFKIVLAGQEGWDRHEAAKWLTMRRWLETNSDDGFTDEIRANLTAAPQRHVTYTRQCLGWGVFALMTR